MQTITTKYHAPTNTTGARISATASNGKRVYVPYSYEFSGEKVHELAVIKLMAIMSWKGKLIAGSTENGYVWVFSEGYTITV